MSRIREIRSLLGVLSKGVSPVWLTRAPSRVCERFARSAKVEVTADDGPDADGLNIVRVNGKPYSWPKDASLDELLYIVSELDDPLHPHQYFWRGTVIRNGDIVLDIGSCEGSFSALAAEHGGKPVAIEPSGHMHRIIRRLFELRNLPAPQIAAYAIGAEPGQMTLHTPANHPAQAHMGDAPQNATSERVEVTTVDALVQKMQLPRVDYIKCDAEGFDVDVIRGATETLRKHRPRLAICTYHAADHFALLSSILKPLGYNIAGKGMMHVPNGFNVMMLHAW